MGTEQGQVRGVDVEVGLALRADRRRRGQSQRAYAAARGLRREVLARAEVDAGPMRLGAVMAVLEGTGFELRIVPTGAEDVHVEWDRTDLRARTRGGSRFPAHREVRESIGGPLWWHYHEMLGRRGDATQPRWTAEGFVAPPGTRYGRIPRPHADNEAPRWPY